MSEPAALILPCPPLNARISPRTCAFNRERIRRATGSTWDRFGGDNADAVRLWLEPCATCPGVLALAGVAGELPKVTLKRPLHVEKTPRRVAR